MPLEDGKYELKRNEKLNFKKYIKCLRLHSTNEKKLCRNFTLIRKQQYITMMNIYYILAIKKIQWVQVMYTPNKYKYCNDLI